MQPIVGFIDEVLAEEHTVQQWKVATQPSGALAVAAVQEHGGDQARQGERHRDEHKRRFEMLELRHYGWQRQQRLEIVRHRRKPPIADSTASMTSTPVIAGGDSWT